MASSKIQVKWSSANSVSVAATGSETSDAISGATSPALSFITCKANHGGTPAAGDYVDFYLAATAGDPDADPDTAAEYPSDPLHMTHLARIDTNTANPDVATVCVPVPSGAKLHAVNNSGASAITVSAQIEQIS